MSQPEKIASFLISGRKSACWLFAMLTSAFAVLADGREPIAPLPDGPWRRAESPRVIVATVDDLVTEPMLSRWTTSGVRPAEGGRAAESQEEVVGAGKGS